MKTIKQTYLINSSLDEVWQALVNPKYINAWGGGPAKMDEKKGTKEKDAIKIDLLHKDVPDNEAKDIEQGWKKYYLEPLKEYLEKKQLS